MRGNWTVVTWCALVLAIPQLLSAADDKKAGRLELENKPEPFVPKVPRTAREQEHLEAMTLFAAGRLHEQRQEYAQALRLYQRALRHDPDAIVVLRQIVPLAFNLDRSEEAVRYALKVVELDPSDQQLIRRLAAHLTDRRDYRGAIRLYERAIKSGQLNEKSPAYVALRAQMGDLYFLVDEFKEASDSYWIVEQALENPDTYGIDDRQRTLLLGSASTTYERFGVAYLKAKRPQDAIRAFQKADKASPNKGKMALHRATVFADTDKPAEALAELEVYFQHQLKSEGNEPFTLLARVLKALDKQDELISRLEKLMAEDGKDPALKLYLADQYRQAGQLDKAEKLFVETLKESPAAEGYDGLLAVYRAQKDPLKLLEVLGNNAAGTEQLLTLPEGKAVASDAALVKQVLESARKQLKDDPEKLTYGMRKAAALLAAEAKQFDAVSEFFQLAIDTNPADLNDVYQQWGLSLFIGERYNDAAKVFQQAIDKKVSPPGDPTLLFHLSGALELAHRTDDALKIAREAAGMRNPPLPILEKRIAWIYYHARRYDDAIKEYERLLKDFAGTPTAKESRLILSNICVLTKDMPRAEEYLEEVLDEYPDDPSASNDLGYLWADQGKHLDRALKMVQHALENDPDNTAYMDSLGWALYKLGRYKEAIKHLKNAVDLDDDPDAVILDHLADCYQRLKETGKALDLWKRALEAAKKAEFPDPELIPKLEKKLELHGQANANTKQLQPATSKDP